MKLEADFDVNRLPDAHPFARLSASEDRSLLGPSRNMVLFTQIGAVVQLIVTLSDSIRTSHGSAAFAFASPLAQLAWIQFRGQQIPPSRWNVLALSLALGLWGMAVTNIPPVLGLALTILRATIGFGTKPAPLKLLAVLPTSRAAIGEQMI